MYRAMQIDAFKRIHYAHYALSLRKIEVLIVLHHLRGDVLVHAEYSECLHFEHVLQGFVQHHGALICGVLQAVAANVFPHFSHHLVYKNNEYYQNRSKM